MIKVHSEQTQASYEHHELNNMTTACHCHVKVVRDEYNGLLYPLITVKDRLDLSSLASNEASYGR